MKRIVVLSISAFAILSLLSCSKTDTTTSPVVVNFGYTVSYAGDMKSCTVSASDASNNIPTNSSISWYCTGGYSGTATYVNVPNASWTVAQNGTFSISERVTVGSQIYSAEKTFIVKLGTTDTAAIKVDFGYSVTYSSDSSQVTIETSDASNNIPTGAYITWYCNGEKSSSTSSSITASWHYNTANSAGLMSITENVLVNGITYSAVHSFIVLKK